MLKGCGLALLAMLLAAPVAAQAQDVLWARKNMSGNMTTVQVGTDGELFCTGCDLPDIGNRRRIPVARASGIDKDVIPGLSPWMSSLWVVVFRVDGGNRCEGDYYALSMTTHRLQSLNKLGCSSVNMTITEKNAGVVVTLTDDRGRRAVTEIR